MIRTIKKTRVCTCCEDTFLATPEYFPRHARGKYGLDQFCKECRQKRNKENRDRKRGGPPKALPPRSDRKGYKICSSCRKELQATTEYFTTQKHGLHGLVSQCRRCCNERSAKYKAAQPWAKRLMSSLPRRHQKFSEEIFDLSEQFLYELYAKQRGKCLWFGVELTVGAKSGPAMISIDRLDNDRGYTRDNVVLCCDAANRGRKDRSVEEFEIFVEVLRTAMRGN